MSVLEYSLEFKCQVYVVRTSNYKSFQKSGLFSFYKVLAALKDSETEPKSAFAIQTPQLQPTSTIYGKTKTQVLLASKLVDKNLFLAAKNQ